MITPEKIARFRSRLILAAKWSACLLLFSGGFACFYGFAATSGLMIGPPPVSAKILTGLLGGAIFSFPLTLVLVLDCVWRAIKRRRQST